MSIIKTFAAVATFGSMIVAGHAMAAEHRSMGNPVPQVEHRSMGNPVPQIGHRSMGNPVPQVAV